ncbi:MAG: hypothetical protein JXR59_00215 [Desulfuromonadaceae bacterium]|nr:hypothetical protein [Desulfuromonadaceae bacterium]
MFVARRCPQCATPVARRAKCCPQCETLLLPSPTSRVNPAKCVQEKLAICCVACCCLAFVVLLGTTSMFREGELIWGGVSLVAGLASIRWAGQLEKKRIAAQEESVRSGAALSGEEEDADSVLG